MMRGMRGFVALCALVWASGGGTGRAQEMGQGEANITARAEVRMSLESGPATNSAKLALIGGVVGGALGDIRRCYQEVTESDPEARGTLRVVIDLTPEGGDVHVHRNELNHRQLERCTLRALRGANYAAIQPPGSAFVVLQFDNSAAEGVGRTRELRAQEDNATITRDAEGRMNTEGGTEIGEVRFRLRGSARATEEQMQAVHRGLRAALPVMLDCRRKAARNHPPYGEITLDLVLRRGRATWRTRGSTVQDARGERCLRRFLGRRRFAEVSGRFRVVIEFRERPGDQPPATSD